MSTIFGTDQIMHCAASWGGGVEDGAAPKIQGAKFFSFSEIRKATDNFSDANEIGVGGYGKVLKFCICYVIYKLKPHYMLLLIEVENSVFWLHLHFVW